jgi:hypothetical protein
MKAPMSTFKLALFHFRLALGFVFAGLAIACIPVSAQRSAMVNAISPFEWEAGE